MPDTYDKWLEAVDQQVIDRTGLSVHDLPDMPFREWYDDDVAPADAALEALDYAGYPL